MRARAIARPGTCPIPRGGPSLFAATWFAVALLTAAPPAAARTRPGSLDRAAGRSAALAPAPGFVSRARAVRRSGCPGHAGVRAALHRNAALTDAARRWSLGEPLDPALQKAGYRALATAGGYVEGDLAQWTQLLTGRLCSALTTASLSDVGAVSRGRQAWIVLAEPFRPPPASAARRIDALVLALVNRARAHPRDCGRVRFGAAPPLRLDARLTRAALEHARDMLAHDYFSHFGRDGSTPAQRVRAAGYAYRLTGENIAFGQSSARHAVQGWLASPEHCRNIMNPHYRQTGVGYASNRRGKPRIYWVQEFGAPLRPRRARNPLSRAAAPPAAGTA